MNDAVAESVHRAGLLESDEVHHAAVMLMYKSGIDADDAIAWLRRQAANAGQSVIGVAHAVINRQLTMSPPEPTAR